ncbi:outer membrane protein W [Sulfurifustis variabilis]|uniref:Outer membrane protein W n=1 Tax=Sulfurifustis variabilis TaxID=1675686 RepID=A0A1C7AFK0_9GAMM|nr:OmpW family outer membrane protein [Sulfurifustis variabilis]BAU50118.1 outer membrane protein W [Sulfurifustis variabilis]
MRTKHKFYAPLLMGGVLGLAAAAPAGALEQGDWTARVGYGQVNPKSDNGSVLGLDVGVDDGSSLAFTLGYMLTDNLNLQVLGALPFKHDVDVQGLGTVAEVEHLPPTVTLQYRFTPKSGVRPYVGAGLNYTTFTSEDTKGALAGADIELDDSFGFALEGGVDVDITRNMFASAAVFYADIETEAEVTGLPKFDVPIDPWVFFVGVGWTF